MAESKANFENVNDNPAPASSTSRTGIPPAPVTPDLSTGVTEGSGSKDSVAAEDHLGSGSGSKSGIGGRSASDAEGRKKSSTSRSSSSTVHAEEHHMPITDHKSMFLQRKTHHRDFVQAKSSQHPLAHADHHSPPSARAQAITFAPAIQSWKEVDDFDEAEEDEGEIDETLFKHDHTYDKLQEIYQHTVTGLEASDARGVNMDPIKNILLKLWEGISRSHQNALRLQRKDHDISVDLSVIMAKTRTLIKLAEEDPAVASRLRTKLENAWGLADIGEAEEKKNALRIYELREDIFMLNRSITAAAKTEGQSTVVELTRLKSQFEVQKNVVAEEVARLNSELKYIFEKRQELSETKTNLEEKFKLLSEEELIYEEALSRENARKDRLQKTIVQTISQSEQKAVELEELVQNLNVTERRLTDVERFVQEQRIVNEDVQHELEISNNKYAKLKQDYETQARLCDRLTSDLFKRQTDLKEKEDEVSQARTMISRMNRQKQANLRKVQEYKAVIAGLEEEREVLKEKLTLLEKELEIAQKKLEDNKKKVDILDHDRALLNRSLERAVAVANSHENQRLTQELAVRNLQTEISSYEKEIGEQQTVISQLEKGRDNYSHEALKLAHLVAVRLEEARKLDRSIYEYQKKMGRVETALRKQQQVYENAVYEKIVTQRQLRDTLSDGVENNIKLMHLSHQIMGLKFQVGEKDTIIHIEASRYERVLRETTFYAGEGKRLKQMAYDMQRMVEALMAERFVLKKTVAAVESEMGRQLYYANMAESRKEVFCRKLMMKEQEMKEICENWRVLHSNIRIGAYHFRNIIAEIRRIRVQIFETKKENIVKSFGKKRVRKLQHEISVLENIISQEICMCNSLRESMRFPINVHRWRVLECTNPDAYDMVLKANLLTKRLVERNAVVRKQDDELHYKQEIYCQIREALSKAPSLETPENVTYYQHLVAAKKRQYKTLKYELQASLLHAKYYEEEWEILKASFQKLQCQFFQKMKCDGKSYVYEYPDDDEVFQDRSTDRNRRSAQGTDTNPNTMQGLGIDESSISLANLANQLPLEDPSSIMVLPVNHTGETEKEQTKNMN